MDWRTSGRVPFTFWRSQLERWGSPLVTELADTYKAAGDLSALALAMMWHESQAGTDWNANSPKSRNVFNLRPRGQDGYQQFPSWAAGVKEFHDRLLDKNYAYARTGTLAEMLQVFAPPSDNNDTGEYIRVVESMIDSFPKEATVGITFGRVPHPPYQDRPIYKGENQGQNNLGRRHVYGVVWHRILGSLWGTDQYFRGAGVNALTDYGVGVTAQDGEAHDGEILRWNDPLGIQSGWASGSYSASAYGDGAAFVADYGIDAINRDQASIEISGFQDTPLSPKAKQAIAGITAYWADQNKIPWDQFPVIPGRGYSFVRWHEEFGPDNGTKKCPFQVVKDATPELIEMTRQTMKQYQEGGVTPPKPSPYARPSVPEWLANDDHEDVEYINKTPVYPVQLHMTCVTQTPRRQATGTNKKIVGPPVKVGEEFDTGRFYRSGGKTYTKTPAGSVIACADLSPKVVISTTTDRLSIEFP